MTYKIGTRVRKIAGRFNVGCTGIVCDGPAAGGGVLDGREDMYVRHDTVWTSTSGRTWPAGTISRTASAIWTPITPDRHEPCEAEFKESLDELLSRENNNETVK